MRARESNEHTREMQIIVKTYTIMNITKPSPRSERRKRQSLLLLNLSGTAPMIGKSPMIVHTPQNTGVIIFTSVVVLILIRLDEVRSIFDQWNDNIARLETWTKRKVRADHTKKWHRFSFHSEWVMSSNAGTRGTTKAFSTMQTRIEMNTTSVPWNWRR